jgi:hypothetical protein
MEFCDCSFDDVDNVEKMFEENEDPPLWLDKWSE